MRKGILYGVLLAAALLAPTDDVELGKMKPVETVSIRTQEGRVLIETDTEDMGSGETFKEALKDLEKTTPGRIYLDTAQYLLIGEEAEGMVPELEAMLKDGTRLCKREGEVDMKTVGEYLRQHTPEMKLKKWKQGDRLEVLTAENGRLKLK